jgi:hypothetical protein
LGFEGDVVGANGEAAGDGLVLANDVSTVRQFILGTSVPLTGTIGGANQFQRADVNNNGILDAGDVTIIRQMILGIAPSNTPATGPVAPTASSSADWTGVADGFGRMDVVGRIFRVVNSTALTAQPGMFQFHLFSQREEASLSQAVKSIQRDFPA